MCAYVKGYTEPRALTQAFHTTNNPERSGERGGIEPRRPSLQTADPSILVFQSLACRLSLSSSSSGSETMPRCRKRQTSLWFTLAFVAYLVWHANLMMVWHSATTSSAQRRRQSSFISSFSHHQQHNHKDNNNNTATKHLQSPLVSPFHRKAFTQAEADDILDRINATVHLLENWDEPYYVYDDPNLVQRVAREYAFNAHRRGGKVGWRNRYGAEMRAEVDILEALEGRSPHPSRLRTTDPRVARHFVVPTPLASMIAVYLRPGGDFDRALSVLYRHEAFASRGGHCHVMLGLAVPLFSPWHVNRMNRNGLRRQYPRLRNVTVATDMDAWGVRRLLTTHRHLACSGDFDAVWRAERADETVTRATFPLNFIPPSSGTTSPFQDAPSSVTEWRRTRPLFLFYYTRTTPSMNNSTRYRHAVLNDTSVDLPPSSMGWSVDATTYRSDLLRSRFCLSVRGDNPQSHALLRAVRAGCIPVVVADCLALYAPTLPSSLNLYDHAVIIPEDEFRRHPRHALRRHLLEGMTDLELDTRLAALRFAQRVVLPKHPRSLFVPAFLREAAAARVKHGLDPC